MCVDKYNIYPSDKTIKVFDDISKSLLSLSNNVNTNTKEHHFIIELSCILQKEREARLNKKKDRYNIP